jgi:hypothetical protein
MVFFVLGDGGLRIRQVFINMTKLLFTEALASVYLNGSPSRTFNIARSVRQGYPLAPYLFLLVGEVLNIQVHKASLERRIVGIKLPTVPIFQIISQYADDTTLFIRGEERFVQNSVELLDNFCSISGLLINWLKSEAYWQLQNLPRPPWTYQFHWTWAGAQDLSKFLGSPFGLKLLCQCGQGRFRGYVELKSLRITFCGQVGRLEQKQESHGQQCVKSTVMEDWESLTQAFQLGNTNV